MELPYEERKQLYLEACERGEIKTVRSMLASGVSITDCIPGIGDGGLHICSRYGTDEHVQIAQFFIDRGVQCEMRNIHGETPLEIAFNNRKEEMIKLLLKNIVNTKLSNGNDIVEILIRDRHYEALEFYIDKGHKVNYSDSKIKQFMTSFLYTDYSFPEDKLNILKLIVSSDILWVKKDPRYLWLVIERREHLYIRGVIEMGVSVNSTNEQGVTPLQYLLQDQYHDYKGAICKCMLEYGAMDYRSVNGRTACHDAIIKTCDEAILKFMLQKGFSCNNADKYGKTPLQYALSLRKMKSASYLLLDADAEDNIDNFGWSTLHYAMAYCDEKALILKMIANGFNINAQSLKDQDIISNRYKYSCCSSSDDVNAKVISRSSVLHVLLRNSMFEESDMCDIISFLIDKGVLLDQIDSKGYLPLHISVIKKLDLVKTLIAVGAKLNSVTDEELNTALHFAVMQKSCIIASLMIKAGADVNQVNKEKQSLIYLATKHNCSKVAALILQKSLHHDLVNMQDKSGNTPLVESIRYKMDTITMSLLHIGAIVNLESYQGETPLLAACTANNEYIVQQLINRKVNVNQKDKYGMTPLMRAVLHGNVKIVKKILSSDCEVNVYIKCDQSKYMLSPIYCAMIQQSKEICHLLMENGADVNCMHYNRNTILHHCVIFHDTMLIQKVAKATRNINIQNISGDTPLHIACKTMIHNINGAKMYQLEKINVLLNWFVDLNIQNNEGDTPLHIACRYDCQEVVYKLLHYGACVNVLNNSGRTCLSTAVQNNNLAIALLLVRNDIITNPCYLHGKNFIHDVIMSSNIHEVDFMLNRVYKFSDLNDIETKIMCIEMYDGLANGTIKYDILLSFLRFGLCPNTCDTRGRNALHYAVSNRDIDSTEISALISLLVRFNADINKCDVDGNSPLLLACTQSDAPTIYSLLYHNASIYTTDNAGRSPVHLLYENLCFHKLQHTCKETIIKIGKEFRPVLNIKDKSNKTALNCILLEEYLCFFSKALIKLGCDINVADGEGIRPLDIVLNYIDNTLKFNMVELMLDHGLEDHDVSHYIDPLVVQVVRKGKNKILEKMVDKKFNMNRKAIQFNKLNEESALEVAIQFNKTAVPLLLFGGADVHCDIIAKIIQNMDDCFFLTLDIEVYYILVLKLLSSGAVMTKDSLWRLNRQYSNTSLTSMHLERLLFEFFGNISSYGSRDCTPYYSHTSDFIFGNRIKTLERLSANAVRKALSYPNIWYGVKQLGLPVLLQDIVTFDVISRYQVCIEDNLEYNLSYM